MNKETTTELVVGNCRKWKKVLIPSRGGTPFLNCKELRKVQKSTAAKRVTETEKGKIVKFDCSEKKCPFYDKGCLPVPTPGEYSR